MTKRTLVASTALSILAVLLIGCGSGEPAAPAGPPAAPAVTKSPKSTTSQTGGMPPPATAPDPTK